MISTPTYMYVEHQLKLATTIQETCKKLPYSTVIPSNEYLTEVPQPYRFQSECIVHLQLLQCADDTYTYMHLPELR